MTTVNERLYYMDLLLATLCSAIVKMFQQEPWSNIKQYEDSDEGWIDGGYNTGAGIDDSIDLCVTDDNKYFIYAYRSVSIIQYPPSTALRCTVYIPLGEPTPGLREAKLFDEAWAKRMKSSVTVKSVAGEKLPWEQYVSQYPEHFHCMTATVSYLTGNIDSNQLSLKSIIKNK